jgi:hypothetical protein
MSRFSAISERQQNAAPNKILRHKWKAVKKNLKLCFCIVQRKGSSKSGKMKENLWWFLHDKGKKLHAIGQHTDTHVTGAVRTRLIIGSQKCTRGTIPFWTSNCILASYTMWRSMTTTFACTSRCLYCSILIFCVHSLRKNVTNIGKKKNKKKCVHCTNKSPPTD